MQATVATKITIQASPAAVFEYLTNLKYHYLWNPQTHSISSTKRIKLGSTYQTENMVLGTKFKGSNVVTALSAPKHLTIENSLGLVTWKADFRLYKRGPQTEVKLSTKVTTDSKVFVFTLPILKKLALRELRTDLQALKIAVEDHLE
ncbi:MAG TPA: SRPBCC family protein [Candidatus Saccharimonadales bacterium]|nr:SRPBCC family protein [Candidatus Saccharimonadales bacterium]